MTEKMFEFVPGVATPLNDDSEEARIVDRLIREVFKTLKREMPRGVDINLLYSSLITLMIQLIWQTNEREEFLPTVEALSQALLNAASIELTASTH